MQLRKLTSLRTFLCGSTPLNGKTLVELTKHWKNLTKLSVRSLDGYFNGVVVDVDLMGISKNLPHLIHLDISTKEHSFRFL